MIVDAQASRTAIARVAPAAAADLQAAYEASPAELGVLCVRHVLVDSEAEAQDVLDELAAGASMADLAAERSTDPSAATNGGAIELTPGQAMHDGRRRRRGRTRRSVRGRRRRRRCPASRSVRSRPTSAGTSSRPGRTTRSPSRSAVAAAEQAFEQYMRDLDVRIDPRYGRWDADQGAVVEL